MGYVDALKELAAGVGLQVPEKPRTREEMVRQARETDLYALMEKAMALYRAELKSSPARHRVPQGARPDGRDCRAFPHRLCARRLAGPQEGVPAL